MNWGEINRADNVLPSGPSHLFLLRVWLSEWDDGQGQASWRGRLQDPVTGQTREFRGWRGLQRAVLHMIAGQQSQGGWNDEHVI